MMKRTHDSSSKKKGEAMVMSGKRLSDYVRFCRAFLVLILLIGATRLGLSLSGIPNSTARWSSMTPTVWIAVVYYSVRVYTSGFGSYKQLLPIIALLNLCAQAIAIAAIAIAILSGRDNIYSSPEFAFGSDGKTWTHLFIGTTVGTLLPWITGSGILAFTRKLGTPAPKVIASQS
jgi:hypothetical protein